MGAAIALKLRFFCFIHEKKRFFGNKKLKELKAIRMM